MRKVQVAHTQYNLPASHHTVASICILVQVLVLAQMLVLTATAHHPTCTCQLAIQQEPRVHILARTVCAVYIFVGICRRLKSSLARSQHKQVCVVQSPNCEQCNRSSGIGASKLVSSFQSKRPTTQGPILLALQDLVLSGHGWTGMPSSSW